MELPKFKIGVQDDLQTFMNLIINVKECNNDAYACLLFYMTPEISFGFRNMALGEKVILQICQGFVIVQHEEETVFLIHGKYKLVYLKSQMKPIFEDLAKIRPSLIVFDVEETIADMDLSEFKFYNP